MAANLDARFDLRQNSDLNITPFVGVMIVLLTVFMAVRPLSTTAVDATHPPADPGTPDPKALPVTLISLQDDGRMLIFYGRNSHLKTSLGHLGADITAAGQADEAIFGRADGHVRYRHFMDMVNQLRIDGYRNINVEDENLPAGRAEIPPTP